MVYDNCRPQIPKCQRPLAAKLKFEGGCNCGGFLL